MKPGAIIEIPNRGRATVVYHQLEGYGVIWGEQEVDSNDLPEPEAILRKPELQDKFSWECVGEEYRLIKEGRFNDPKET